MNLSEISQNFELKKYENVLNKLNYNVFKKFLGQKTSGLFKKEESQCF